MFDSIKNSFAISSLTVLITFYSYSIRKKAFIITALLTTIFFTLFILREQDQNIYAVSFAASATFAGICFSYARTLDKENYKFSIIIQCGERFILAAAFYLCSSIAFYFIGPFEIVDFGFNSFKPFFFLPAWAFMATCVTHATIYFTFAILTLCFFCLHGNTLLDLRILPDRNALNNNDNINNK